MGKPTMPPIPEATPNVVGEEVRSEGINETTPAEQRGPKGAALSEGPRMGTKDEFLPASYSLPSGNIRTDR